MTSSITPRPKDDQGLRSSRPVLFGTNEMQKADFLKKSAFCVCSQIKTLFSLFQNYFQRDNVQ